MCYEHRVKALWIAASLLALGCSKKNDAAVDASAPPAPSVTASVASTAPRAKGDAGAFLGPWTAIPNATAPVLMNMPIPERFEIEKKARPDLKPKVEDAFAALKKAGLTIVDEKQHLAQPVGARYCVGARAVAGDTTLLQISICEYMNDEVARTSTQYSEESLKKLMPTRTCSPHKHLGLILRPENASPEADAAAKKARAAFDAL